MTIKKILILIIFVLILMKIDINIIISLLIVSLLAYNKTELLPNSFILKDKRSDIKNGFRDIPSDLPDYSIPDNTEKYINEILGVSADDSISNLQMISSQKHKNSLDIVANKTSDQNKRYFVEEFEQEENRDWWIDDEYNLSKKFKI